MAIRRPPTTFSDSITGADLASDIAISTTGNIATTGSGALTVAGNTTLSGTNNLGSNPTIQLGSNATGFTGIKNIDVWLLNANVTGSVDPISYSKYSRASASSGGANLGTGMDLHDVSGDGVFTFPVTGIWRIDAGFNFEINADSRYIINALKISSTGKSGSFSTIGRPRTFIQRTSSNPTQASNTLFAIVDVTTAGDTSSSIAVTFQIAVAGSVTTIGATPYLETYFSFTRLADT